MRSVAQDYGLSHDALQRHVANHLARYDAVATPDSAATGDEGGDAAPDPLDPLAELVVALRPKALTGDPQVAHQYRLALAARDESRNAAPQIRDLSTEPEWIALRARLLDALEPYPEATAAVVAALEGM